MMMRSNTANENAGSQSMTFFRLNAKYLRVDREREKSSSDIPTLTVSPVMMRNTPTPPMHLMTVWTLERVMRRREIVLSRTPLKCVGERSQSVSPS